MATAAQLQTIARHFCIAACWGDCEEGTHPRPTAEALKNAAELAAAFIAECPDLFALAMQAEGYGSHPDAGSPEAAFGHDLYLTIRGHGVGFWDRDELDTYPNGPKRLSLGDALTEICDKFYHEPEFYRGWLYVRWSRKNC